MSQIRTVGAERDIGRRKRRFLYGGTDGSNPVPSSEESAANPESLDQAVLISGDPNDLARRFDQQPLERPEIVDIVNRQIEQCGYRLITRGRIEKCVKLAQSSWARASLVGASLVLLLLLRRQ